MKKVIIVLSGLIALAVFAYYFSFAKTKDAIILNTDARNNMPKIEDAESIGEAKNKIETGQTNEINGSEDSWITETEIILKRIIEAINTESIEGLSQYAEGYDKEQIKTALKYYRTYFNGMKVSGFEFVGKEPVGPEDSYIYRIFSSDGRKKEITLVKKENRILIGFDNFFYHAKNADIKVKEYLASIKMRKTKRLSFSIWNSIEPVNTKGEIEIYPMSMAQSVIDKYVENFDIDTLEYKFTGDMTEEYGKGQFIFNLFGKKNNKFVEHKIFIHTGDGQVGISDEWIVSSDKHDVINPRDIISEHKGINLPDIIKLTFNNISLESITQIHNKFSMKKVKTKLLGTVNKNELYIDLYADYDNNVHGVIRYKAQQYELYFLEYLHNIDSIEIYNLNLRYVNESKVKYLVSVIGSPTLGYRYIFFDEENNRSETYHNWGKPYACDINNDGINEVLMQFQGANLHLPNLTILRYKDGEFGVCEINADVSKFVNDDLGNRVSSVFNSQNGKKRIVNLSVIGEDENSFQYYLEDDNLKILK